MDFLDEKEEVEAVVKHGSQNKSSCTRIPLELELVVLVVVVLLGLLGLLMVEEVVVVVVVVVMLGRSNRMEIGIKDGDDEGGGGGW